MGARDVEDLVDRMMDGHKIRGAPPRLLIKKSVFNWPGSKIQSIPQLLDHVPYLDGYCEPFGGSAALLINRHRSKIEVYNDRFGGLTDFWICLRDNHAELEDRLKYDVYSRELWEHYKATWEQEGDRLERAARWYYSTIFSFGQLGRNFGRGVTAAGDISSRLKCKIPMFEQLAKRLNSVIIENLSWEAIFDDYDSPTMAFYCDPPYLETPNGTYKNTMNRGDHIRFLNRVMQCEGHVCVSGYKNDLLDSYTWDEVVHWEVKDHLSPMTIGNSGNEKRKIDVEYLYIKGLGKR
jgi:DNA adenine methylase